MEFDMITRIFDPLQLAKVYDEDAEEDDLVEREEERNRMREHVFSEVDKDKDGMISLKEFLSSTDQKEFNEDQGWKVSVTEGLN